MEKQKQLRTPLIKPRKQGGTFYTFGSALEDIGLNINELNNKVVLSHYALLDIPEFNSSTFGTSLDYRDSSNAGDMIFAEGFQNYVLNMEAAVRNHAKYDFTNSITVSERIFWKWLKSQMDLDVSTRNDVTRYIDNNSIVKCFGYINSGAQRSDDYSMYNETFVQVPSSFGQMRVLYKVTEDDNYYADSSYYSNNNGYLESIDCSINSTEVTDDVLNKTGISALGIFDDPENFAYNVNDTTDLLTIDFDLDSLRKFYGNEHITFDDLAIYSNSEEENYVIAEAFEFNAVLVYYSIYDSTGKNILATNAYGLLLLNNSEPTYDSSESFKFETLNKKMATSTMSGTSYSFRLNIKVSSVYSGDIVVDDNSTPAYSMSTDFNDTVKNLYTAINILRSNANLIAAINSDYRHLKNLTIEAIEKADEAEKQVAELKDGNFKKLDSSTLHTNNIVVGNGISFDAGGGFYKIANGGVAVLSDLLDSSTVYANKIDTVNLHTDKIMVHDNGITLSDGNDEEEIAKIDHRGVSSKAFMLTQDQAMPYTGLSLDTLNTVLDNIESMYDPNSNEFFINITTGAEGEAGNVLSALYDQETKRIDLKVLLALLITKIKTMSNE